MKKSGFIEGTVIATAAIVITKILGMLYVIPFYAMIGIQGSALYAYAYNIYVIFLDISSAGLPVAISKIIKEYKQKYNDKEIIYKLVKELKISKNKVAKLMKTTVYNVNKILKNAN